MSVKFTESGVVYRVNDHDLDNEIGTGISLEDVAEVLARNRINADVHGRSLLLKLHGCTIQLTAPRTAIFAKDTE